MVGSCGRPWIASCGLSRSEAGLLGRIETGFPPIHVILLLGGGIGQDLVGLLDGLKPGHALGLFAGIAIGVVLQG